MQEKKDKNIMIILLGPPGVGKGTQASMLKSRYSIPALSSGNALSGFIKNESENSTADEKSLIADIKSKISRGELIEDDIVTNIVGKRLSNEDCAKGFILDGFPRNIRQAQDLPALLDKYSRKQQTSCVISISLDADSLLKRIMGRIVCANCRASYNMFYLKTKVEGVCDECGGKEFVNRSDDKEEVIKNRIITYEKETSPLIEYYKKSGGNVLEVEGDNSHLNIFRSISSYIDSL